MPLWLQMMCTRSCAQIFNCHVGIYVFLSLAYTNADRRRRSISWRESGLEVTLDIR